MLAKILALIPWHTAGETLIEQTADAVTASNASRERSRATINRRLELIRAEAEVRRVPPR